MIKQMDSSSLLIHEQIIIIIWYVIALILCLTGNFVVMHATIKHDAIKLDKMSVWIVQNLAVADILRGLFNVFPAIIVLTTGYELPTVCKILLAIKYCFIDANSFFVNALVVNKLYRCVVPLAWPPKQWHRVIVTCGGLATSSIYMSITFYQAITSSQVSFVHDYMGCTPQEDTTEVNLFVNPSVDVILSLIVVIVPIAMLVFSNSALILIAGIKGRGQVKRKNILIVLATTSMFFISNFPYVLWCLDFYNIIALFDGRTLVIYTRFTFIVMHTSCFINPFIYYLTNKGFRGYCKKKIARGKKAVVAGK